MAKKRASKKAAAKKKAAVDALLENPALKHRDHCMHRTAHARASAADTKFYIDPIISIADFADLMGVSLNSVKKFNITKGLEPADLGKSHASSKFFLSEMLQAYNKEIRSAYDARKLKGEARSSRKKTFVSPLDKRKIRQLDIKNAKEEQQWAPTVLLQEALAKYVVAIRTRMSACVPTMRRRYGDNVSHEIYMWVEESVAATLKEVARIDFEDAGINPEDFDFYDPSDPNEDEEFDGDMSDEEEGHND